MSFDWYAELMRHEEEEGMREFLQESIDGISRDAAKTYLGTYGDAIDARVESCLRDSESLLSLGYEGPALCLAATSVELMIRFLLLRPLIQGAFLSDEWASILANRIASGRSAEDRELLPAVLKNWDINIENIETSSGIAVWQFILTDLWPNRNKFVHRGDRPKKDAATVAIECARLFRQKIVGAVASKLGFTLETTGKWCIISGKEGTRSWGQSFDPRDSFIK